jgi:hypothetical protein
MPESYLEIMQSYKQRFEELMAHGDNSSRKEAITLYNAYRSDTTLRKEASEGGYERASELSKCESTMREKLVEGLLDEEGLSGKDRDIVKIDILSAGYARSFYAECAEVLGIREAERMIDPVKAEITEASLEIIRQLRTLHEMRPPKERELGEMFAKAMFNH